MHHPFWNRVVGIGSGLALLGTLLAALPVYAATPAVRVEPSRTALARFVLRSGQSVEHVSVTIQGRAVPITVRRDRIVPRRLVAPAAPAAIRIVTRPSGLAAFFGGTTVTRTEIMTPAPPKPQAGTVTVRPGGPVRLHFTAPIARLAVGRHATATGSVTPPVTAWTVGTAAQRQGASGTLWVRVAARAWERLSTAQPVHWQTPPALTVVSSPYDWQWQVPGKTPIVLHFSEPLDRDPVPTLSPPIAGHWSRQGSTLVFHVHGKGYPAGTVVNLAIPGGPTGFRGANGAYLSQTVYRTWITKSPYHIVIREALPETLTLYRGKTVVFKSLCNTGIAGAATPVGHFHVQTKLVYANMRGTEPDGQPYYAPHVPWVMPLVGNVAIHGYVRAQYGFPQSVGCIELPVANAKRLYALTPIGTPVTILPPS